MITISRFSVYIESKDVEPVALFKSLGDLNFSTYIEIIISFAS